MEYVINWLVLGDEQMSKGWPFSLLNDEQMSNWLGVEHQPGNDVSPWERKGSCWTGVFGFEALL